MNVVVLIAGVHDPKWPIALDGAGSAHPVADHQVPSPFDEAALEIALRLRDARPDTRIAAYVAGGAAGTKIARTVAALNITDVSTVVLAQPWDQADAARALAPLCADADLILTGREFGDFDDGLVPALLAGILDLPLFARVQAVEPGDEPRLMREVDSFSETVTLSRRMVASVTNDRRTRLRKPLMKNVMQARQAVIAEVRGESEMTPVLALESLAPRTAGRGKTDCTMIPGSPQDQARALAGLLWEARQ